MCLSNLQIDPGSLKLYSKIKEDDFRFRDNSGLFSFWSYGLLTAPPCCRFVCCFDLRTVIENEFDKAI